MFTYIKFLLEQPLKVPMVYGHRLGAGRAVSVRVKDDGLELSNLVFHFERKIEHGDVEGGKLRPIATEEVKRRGGKRLTTLTLSYEAAEALSETLNRALKDARQRRLHHNFIHRTMSTLLEMSRSWPSE